MNTTEVTEKQKVGVIFVKEGSCQGWYKPTVDRIRSLLYEISVEAGVFVKAEILGCAATFNIVGVAA